MFREEPSEDERTPQEAFEQGMTWWRYGSHANMGRDHNRKVREMRTIQARAYAREVGLGGVPMSKQDYVASLAAQYMALRAYSANSDAHVHASALEAALLALGVDVNVPAVPGESN